MPVVPIYLNIDDKTYQGIKAGTLELYGLAKNANTKRVAKHIPTVADATKESASKAIDFVRAHQKGTFIISGVLMLEVLLLVQLAILHIVSRKNSISNLD